MSLINLLTHPVPDVPGLPPSPQTPGEWFKWRRKVLEHRARVYYAISQPGNEGIKARTAEFIKCKNPAYCANTFGVIYEARPDEENDTDTSGFIPFIMFPYQITLFDQLDRAMRTKGPDGDVLEVKGREVGASNATVFWFMERWRTDKRFKGHFLSRREDLVDDLGNPDSLFWKGETYLRGLPDFLLPSSFKWGPPFRKAFFLMHPESKNTITGESTNSEAGRAARSSAALLDEWGFMKNGRRVHASMQATTRHRIMVSTPNAEHGSFMEDLHNGVNGYTQPRVLLIPSECNPFHDDRYFADESQRLHPDDFAREHRLDYHAGRSVWVYPNSHSIIPDPDVRYVPGLPVVVALDDGFRDHFAITWWQYEPNYGRFKLIEAYQNTGLPTDFYGSIMTGIPSSEFSSVYGERELDLMKFTRHVHATGCLYVGDPHGANEEQTTGQSPYFRLSQRHNIVVMMDFEKRSYKDRREATNQIIPFIDVAAFGGAPQALYALQRSRFRKEDDDRETTREDKEPIHDGYAHFRSAIEYLAVNAPVVTMSGGWSLPTERPSREKANGPTIRATR